MFVKRKRSGKLSLNLKPSWRTDVGEYVRGISSNVHGTRLAVISAASTVFVFNPKDGRRLWELPGHGNGVAAASWHKDGCLLATVGHDGHVRIWDTLAGKQLWADRCGAAWVERCEFRPDGTLLAVSAGRSVRLYSIDGLLQRDIAEHPSTVADVRWMPDGSELVVARYGGLHFWNPDQAEPARTLNYRGSVLKISISPLANFIATADQNSTVHFWRTVDWNDAEMSGFASPIHSLSWDDSGRYLATDGGSDAFAWDCSPPGPEERMPTFLKGKSDSLARCVTFAPGRLDCATGDQNGSIALHDVNAPNRCEVDQLDAAITVLCWGPTSSFLVAGTESGTIQCYA